MGNRGKGESISKSIDATTKASSFFRDCGVREKKREKRIEYFWISFFHQFGQTAENSLEIVSNAVLMEVVAVNFYKLKFRPCSFIDLKRLSRRAGLEA